MIRIRNKALIFIYKYLKSQILDTNDCLAYYIRYCKANPYFFPKAWYDLNSKFYSLFIYLQK